MKKPSALLSTSQAARSLGLCSARVVQLARSGALRPAVESPLGRLFASADIDAYRRIRAQRMRRRRAERGGEGSSEPNRAV